MFEVHFSTLIHLPPLSIKSKVTSLYFSPKVTNPAKALWCKNHENPIDRKSHTWAPLQRRVRAAQGCVWRDQNPFATKDLLLDNFMA